MNKIEREKARIARLIGANFGDWGAKITIRYVPETGRVPTKKEARRAARVIQRLCNSRKGDTACKRCPIRDICRTEPYSWVLPCADCGEDSEPRIKCRHKGPVCVKCCEACHRSEPFPCPEYDAFKAGGGNNAL